MDDRIRMREKAAIYFMTRIPGWGAVKIRLFGEHMGSFGRIFNIEERRLRAMDFLTQRDIERWSEYKSQAMGWREELQKLEERNIQFITPLDEEYPARLKEIYDYPMGLYVRGHLPDGRPSAAIVGARGCSAYGRIIAGELGRQLAENGIQVISGLAAGIDGAGHRGALEGGGETFGVLGCGIDICYPREHYSLFAELCHRGGVISEYGLGTKPLPGNFPMRNRIISGLADVVIVVEARERSGSLITVDLALEQGREIYAVPGRVGDPLSEGCNRLIQQGAQLCAMPEDILEYFGIDDRKNQRVLKKSGKGLAKKEKMVYSCLDLHPKHLEEITALCGLPVEECMNILTELEFKGYAEAEAGQYYGIKL